MKKIFQSYFLAPLFAILGLFAASCNSNETWGTDPQNYSGTAVTGFSLKADKEVLNNLDSVYFSIDLIEGKIFNANPLPFGTKINTLAVNIKSDACSLAELKTSGNDEKEASVINYLTTPDEKIDFSNGPVKLHLVSADGLYEREYEIRVNVAAEKSDSLYWDELQAGTLKGVASMRYAKTVKSNDKAIMLSISYDGKAGISTFMPESETGGGRWEEDVIEPRFTNAGATVEIASLLNIESFTANTDGELYIIDNNGGLYTSSDNGANFTWVDNGWKSITATYGDTLLGIKENAGILTVATYPASSLSGQLLPSDFPVSGVSAAVEYTSKWATSSQVVIAGGKCADGSLTGAVWACDGNKWTKTSDRLPAAVGYAMAKYTIAETDTVSWRIKAKDVLIAFGGAGIKPVIDVWISRDMGVNWQKGSSLLQLPEYIPFTTGSSLLVFEKTLSDDNIAPLAATPVTSWKCPYLYLFGGYDINGNLQQTYWSGVVNHLKVKPLQ